MHSEFDNKKYDQTPVRKKTYDDIDTLTPLVPEEPREDIADLVYKLKTFLNNNPDPANWKPRTKQLVGILAGALYEKILQ